MRLRSLLRLAGSLAIALAPMTLIMTEARPADAQAAPAGKPALKKKPKLKPALSKPDQPAPEPAPAATPAPDTAKADTPASTPETTPPAATAPTTPDAVSCPQDRIDSLVHDLNEWTNLVMENERHARAERGCGQANIVCLDRLGEPGPDPLPERVRAGNPLSVYAIVPAIDHGRITLSTSIRASTAQSQTVTETDPPPKSPPAADSVPVCKLMAYQKASIKSAALPLARFAAQPGLEALTVPTDSGTDAYWSSTDDMKILNDWFAWQSEPRPSPRFTALRARMEVPSGDMLSIDFARTERGARTPSIEKHYDLLIDNGRYYVEPALLVPFIYHGSRTVQLAPTVSGTELRLDVEQDWRVTAAAMIDIFPLGRQKEQISSFRFCRYRSCIDNWLGVQIGTGLDPVFRDWYFGALFEPVSGVAFAFGAVLLKGDFLIPGRAEGMLIPTADTPVKYEDYMVRAYFGASFTLDLLDTLDRGAVATKRALF
jgi:hypothetical protein